jgi:hypothetical protein
MILLENIDGKIWHIETKIVDMVKEYQDQNSLTISLNGEGPCCEAIGLYKILDHMCENFNIDKKKITILTVNKIEQHAEYNIKKVQSHFIESTATALQHIDTTKRISKHVGLFIGRSNGFRLWIASWIWKNYRDKTIMSFHFDPSNEFHLAHIGLDGMLRWQATPCELQDATDLIERSPLIIDSPDNYPILYPEHLNIIKEYKNFFLDIVMETYFSNNTFFMTEKIVRPIMAMSPFIVFAAPGFLRNMRGMGYKTFDRWWSEEYDNYGEQLRIRKIQKILKDIYAKSTAELRLMLDEMEPILKHNRELTIEYAKQR